MNERYAELLKDERWKRRSRLFLLRHPWCKCGAPATQTHHKVYYWGRDPWDYTDEDLQPVCVNCHPREDELRKERKSEPLPPINPDDYPQPLYGDFVFFDGNERVEISRPDPRDDPDYFRKKFGNA